MRRHTGWAALALLCGLLIGAPTARAADGDEREAVHRALKLFKSGTTHYNLGEYKQALADYKEAYRLKPDAAFLFNMGQAYRQMGDSENAAQSYRAYLRERPEAPNRAAVERFIADADAAIAASRAARAPTAVEPPAEAATHPSPAVVPPPVAPAAAPPRRGTPTWVWVAVGVGAAVVAGGAIALAVGLSSTGAPDTYFGTRTVSF